MKKFITLALVLILTLSMAVVSFAENSSNLNNDTLTDDVTITGTYASGAAADTISVSISWENAAWTYSVKNTWDPVNHVEVVNEGTWTNDTGEATTIKLINNSNVAIYTTYDAIPVADGAVATLGGDSNVADSVRAANSTDGAAEENVTLTISGMLTGEYTDGQTGITVATVTITIEKAA